MSDLILKTSEIILNRLELEEQINIRNRAIGYALLTMDGAEKRFWLMKHAADNSPRIRRDLNGNIISIEPGSNPELKVAGDNVFRDSKLGGFIIQHGLGEHIYTPHGTQTFHAEIKLKTTYNPGIVNEEPDGSDGLIEDLSPKTYTFSSLRGLAEELKELLKTKKKLEVEIEAQKEFLDKVAILKNELAENEKAIVEKQQALKKHMSYEIQLRERGTLDKFQDVLRREKVFDGTLIINGGPGTGKTTMLIQRITFLTTPTIEEVFVLSEQDKNIIFNQERNWIFFSPSELLRSYLDYAIRKEGLTSTKEKVTTWELFKQKAVREYGFVNPETRRPFIFLKGRTFYNGNFKNTRTLNDNFTEYFINSQRKKLQRSFELNTASFSWHSLALRMKSSLRDLINFKDLSQLVNGYYNFRENFSEETRQVRVAYRSALDELANILQVNVESADDLNNWFNQALQTSDETQKEDIDEEPEDDLDNEGLEENEVISPDYRIKLSKLLKRIVGRYALSTIDQNTRLKKEDRAYLDKIAMLFDDRSLKPIAEGAYFVKYYERISRGVESNLLREFTIIYKLFRKEMQVEIESLLNVGGNTTLNEILTAKTEKNKKITTSEFDFFFHWINSLIKTIYRVNTRLYDSSKDTYIVAFKNLYKGIIAIDEATDFSPLELLGMSSFAYPKFNCVTLSGDLMQRMTDKGLHRWEDFTSLLENATIGSLKIAYRQTPPLLNLASLVYEKNTGLKPDFESYTAPDTKYPLPLYYINKEEENRIQWLADRIEEINKVYRPSIPSIAVFAKDDSEVVRIAGLLNNNSTISELYLSAVPCIGGQILGDKQNIRVFPIEHIKGLEFETVFFWDIDNLSALTDDLLDKFIYVGLSRATFYLGITAINDFPDKLTYLKGQMVTGKW